jgi:hypothetical protein
VPPRPSLRARLADSGAAVGATLPFPFYPTRPIAVGRCLAASTGSVFSIVDEPFHCVLELPKILDAIANQARIKRKYGET